MSSSGNKSAYVELSFAPSWELISDVRRFVSVFYQRTLQEPDAASRLALAAHELLENAAKYSLDGEAHLRLEVERDPTATHLRIRMQNRATPAEIERLQRCFDAMGASQDALEHYQKLMVAGRGSPERAGLGLARIQAEAEMLLRHEVEGDRVTILGTTNASGQS